MTQVPSQPQRSEPVIGAKSSDGAEKSGGGLAVLSSVGAPVAKLHYLKFYPESWMAEIGLRMCSLAARGLWIDLICHMAKSPEHGVLLSMSGKPIADAQIHSLVGVESKTVIAALVELEENGVLSRRPDGAIVSRRMVRDHAEYVRQAAFGSKGGRSKRGGLEAPLKAPLEAPLEGSLKACVDSRVLGSRFSDSGSDSESTPVSGSAAAFLADRAIRTGATPPGFAEFIAQYPAGRATNRVETLEQWKASVGPSESQNVLAGLQTWLASEQFREGYAPKADKFLRERHWEQQPPPPKSRGVVSADDAVARFRARQAAKAAKEGA